MTTLMEQLRRQRVIMEKLTAAVAVEAASAATGGPAAAAKAAEDPLQAADPWGHPDAQAKFKDLAANPRHFGP